MGMAALGDSEKYMSYFENKLTAGLFDNDGNGSIDFDYLKEEADKEEQNRFDISASRYSSSKRARISSSVSLLNHLSKTFVNLIIHKIMTKILTNTIKNNNIR